MPTKTDYILIGIGALTAVLLTSYVPSLMKVMSAGKTKALTFPQDYANCPECKELPNTTPFPIEDFTGHVPLSLDSIPGIDLESLRISRERGLI